MEKVECIKQHAEIRAAQKEICIERIINFKGTGQHIYSNYTTNCPNCGIEIRTLMELKTTFTIDGYLD